MTYAASKGYYVRKLLVLVLAAVGILVGCQPQQVTPPEDPMSLLQRAADAVRSAQTFRLYVEQTGDDYVIPIVLGGGVVNVQFRFARAQYVHPDTLQASVRIVTESFPRIAMDVEVFSISTDQWFRVSQLDWVNEDFAPGFNPVALIAEDSGFQAALTSLVDLDYLGRTILENGMQVHHLRGVASGPKVSALVVGLLNIQGLLPLEVFLDADTGFPARLILELPGTAPTAADEPTRWTINVYDINQPVDVVPPGGVDWTAPAIVAPVTATAGRIPFEALAQLGILALVIGAAIAVPVMLWPRLRPQIDAGKAPAAVRPWLIVAIVSVPVFIGALDLTVVSAFLPELIVDLEIPLQTGLDDAAWIVSGYLLAYAISMTFMGRVSDLVGRRMVYVICLGVFAAGSILVAMAHLGPTDFFHSLMLRLGHVPDRPDITLAVIILGRIVQALGAGALVPVSLALVADVFPPMRRARALGVIGAVDTLGWVLGHLYGGIAVQFMPWQGLFWINVPITAAALVLMLVALRGVPDVRERSRFDYVGAFLIVLALAGLTLGLGANIEVGVDVSGFEELSPLPAYAAPVLLGVALSFILFILVERRVKSPLIDLRMFRRRALSVGLLANLFVGYVLFVGLVTVPILVNVRLEGTSTLQQTALVVGLMLCGLTVPMAAAAFPGGWLSERIGARTTTVAGLLIAAFGFVLVWRTWTYTVSDALVVLEMVIIGIGIGLTFSPISASVIDTADEHHRGVASALVIVLRLVGMTLSVSTLTALALTRVNTLLSQRVGVVEGLEDINAAAQITVEVLAEVGLVAAVLCLIGAGIAMLLPNTHTGKER
ncbi:MAG: major facilitator superfamily protein [Chloroflexi bacterium OLB13]|nr:MAG: major facilitator superfamily protein [Chloroflexi bacterium OLB13]